MLLRAIRQHALLQMPQRMRATRGVRIMRDHDDRLAELAIEPVHEIEDVFGTENVTSISLPSSVVTVTISGVELVSVPFMPGSMPDSLR